MIRHFLSRWFASSRRHRLVRPRELQKRLEHEALLVEACQRRTPHIPIVQYRTGADDSALGTARFADLEARPRRIFWSDDPAVTYVELEFRFAGAGDRVYQANLGKTRIYARIEDPLCLNSRRYTVEEVRARDELRTSYFEKVFALMLAQSACNRAMGRWWRDFFLPDAGGSDRDLLATIQFFNHNIVTNGQHSHLGRNHFCEVMSEFDFAGAGPAIGPVSLRQSVRPHRQDDGSYTQSITSLLVGTNRGPAFRQPNGTVDFPAPGNAFEKRFRKFIAASAKQRLDGLKRPSWRRNAEERTWGGPGECEAYFHNHDRFVMKGLEWILERNELGHPQVMGTHRNVAAFRCGQHRVAVKAVPFESASDLVRLTQAHQYVHGVQAPALLAMASGHPALSGEIITRAISVLNDSDNQPLADAREARIALDRNWSSLFKRNIGPLLHQTTVDYEQKLILTVLDWSAGGMLADSKAYLRLLEDCSLSHRLRLAANLFRNGHQMLEDDVTHTDLKPENILNLPGPAFEAMQKARREGWQALNDRELEHLDAGESAFEGDFSGIHFGREGAIDNLARGEGIPTSIQYSSWKFTSLGLSEGAQPIVLRKQGGELPRIDSLLLEQDIANRGTTAWEIVYGSLVDCIPPAEEARRLNARKVARERVAHHIETVIRAKREKREEPGMMKELEAAMQQCDNRLLDVVSLRSEIIDGKRRITPLFQQARDNCNGLTVWIDPRVIDMLDHLACDFRRSESSRHQVAKLYRTAETLLRAEAGRLERADRKTAGNRRHKMVSYLQARSLHFNPDCGLLGLPDLPRQLERMRRLVEELPDPRRALKEFTDTWQHARQWGANLLDALDHLQAALDNVPVADDDKGRSELRELVRSAVLQEHAALSRDESCVEEDRIRPPHLGVFEARQLRIYNQDGSDQPRFGYVVDN